MWMGQVSGKIMGNKYEKQYMGQTSVIERYLPSYMGNDGKEYGKSTSIRKLFGWRPFTVLTQHRRRFWQAGLELFLALEFYNSSPEVRHHGEINGARGVAESGWEMMGICSDF